jgi:hypothetical protein
LQYWYVRVDHLYVPLLSIWPQSRSFSAYDQFCSNYELLTHDVALLRRSIANWTIYDLGIEALSKSVASIDRRRAEDSKSMTFNDLLIKVCANGSSDWLFRLTSS